jgi:hypothetical protein
MAMKRLNQLANTNAFEQLNRLLQPQKYSKNVILMAIKVLGILCVGQYIASEVRKSAVFRMHSALTSNGYRKSIKAVRRQRNLGLTEDHIYTTTHR